MRATLPKIATAAVGAPTSARLADFLELAKPRTNFLVLVTTAVGFAMATRRPIEWANLVHALFGTALTAAAAAALNQYIERRFDALMARTANRPLPAARMNPRDALLFGVGLSIIGPVYLAILVNPLTALLGAITLALYAFAYTPLKRVTPLCTLVGAIPGAIPPMMGWAAVRGSLGPEPAALFAILFLWQVPHFLAIGILYRRQYAAAGFRMLPVVDPTLAATGRQIVLFAACLLPAALLPAGLQMACGVYLAGALGLSVALLAVAAACARTHTRPTAKLLFLASVLYLPLLLALLMLDKA